MIPEDQPLTDAQVLDLRRRYTILFETMSLVRQYPDFDNDSPLGNAMDAAMRGELPEMLEFVLQIRETYGPPQTET